jgi:murein L,D-transpeptidase YcbB/YkuD
VEQPFELAELLLAGQGGWDSAKLESAISRGTNRGIAIERPLPVHLVYWTAWVDEAGRTQFRNDIYNRDSNVYAPGADQQRGT